MGLFPFKMIVCFLNNIAHELYAGSAHCLEVEQYQLRTHSRMYLSQEVEIYEYGEHLGLTFP